MMALTRRERQRLITADEIKQVARRQMAESGAAVLSLRAIAAEMGLTAPALYRYYPNRDALVTALIVDAFDALGTAIRDAASSDPQGASGERMLAALRTYRAWALAHPAEFALLFGTPIPGYVAPRETTIPAAARAFAALVDVLRAAWESGWPAESEADPQATAAPRHHEASLPAARYEQLIAGWGTVHGLVSLELSGHLGPVVADIDATYERAIREVVQRLDLSCAPSRPP